MKPDDPVWLEEASLARRAVEDRLYFAALYDRYFGRVYNYMRFRCNDPQVADDLTAQVFEKVLKEIWSYRPERAPFAVWLFTIARNVHTDYLRAKRRAVWLPLELLNRFSGNHRSPEEDLVEFETRHELLQALASLDERERELLALKFQAGLNNRQIAELTHLSESNVGVILYRSIHRLRAVLKSGAEFEGEANYERA